MMGNCSWFVAYSNECIPECVHRMKCLNGVKKKLNSMVIQEYGINCFML